MNALPTKLPTAESGACTPCNELRVQAHGADDTEMEVWQVPAPKIPTARAHGPALPADRSQGVRASGAGRSPLERPSAEA